jgi:hypothetical protein
LKHTITKVILLLNLFIKISYKVFYYKYIKYFKVKINK